jgi:signal transduction histidine kinase
MRIPFKLRQYVIPRILPIMIMLIVLLSTSVPAVYFILKVKEAGFRAMSIAREASGLIKREVYANPVLWKYDTTKLTTYVEDHSFQPSLAGIFIEDENGCIVNVENEDGLEPLRSDFIVWGAFPLVINNHPFGRVLAGIDTNTIRNHALLLIIPFLLAGLLLSGGIYFYAIRLIGKAQDTMEDLFQEVVATRDKLDELNRNLERMVEAKTDQLKKACEEINESRENIRKISTKSIMLQEEEKKSAAMDLHDSLGQTLTAIRIDMERLGGDMDPQEKHRILRRCMKLADEAMDELRHLVEAMRPPILDYAGLEGALQKTIERFEDRSEAAAEADIRLDGRDMPPAVEIACYRIVQEALTNVMKHATATRVDIAVTADDHALTITVRDDGAGFVFEDAVKNDSQGIAGIRERAEILGGKAAWDTAPGRGCTMTVQLPLPAPGAKEIQ